MPLNRLTHTDWRQFNPIQDGEGGREGKTVPPASFSPVTSTNVGPIPQIFMIFSFNSFPHWCKISSPYLVSVPNY